MFVQLVSERADLR